MTIQCNREAIEMKKGNKSIHQSWRYARFVEAESNQELIITCLDEMQFTAAKGEKENETNTISINHSTFWKSIFQCNTLRNGMHYLKVIHVWHPDIKRQIAHMQQAVSLSSFQPIFSLLFPQINWFQFRFNDCSFNLYYTWYPVEMFCLYTLF